MPRPSHRPDLGVRPVTDEERAANRARVWTAFRWWVIAMGSAWILRQLAYL